MAQLQFCTFSLQGLFLGVTVQRVQEVIRYQEMTRVPLAPRVVKGLINLRGQIVTALDLRRRLELEDFPPQSLPINVVVNTDEGPMSLQVDEIGDVVEVEETALERPPETIKGMTRELIQSVFKLKDRLLLILDIDKILTGHKDFSL